MPRTILLAPMLGLVLGLAATAAAADVVVLKNGDRLSGSVVKKAGGTLTLKTGFANELKIDWSQVQSLTTDSPVEVLKSDGTSVRTTVIESGSTAPGAVAPTDVAFVSPDAAEAGRGYVLGGHVTVAATSTRGNSDSQRLYGEGEVNGRSHDTRFFVGASRSQGSEAGVDTVSNWLAKGEFDWYFARPQFVYGRTSFQRDRFADVDLRSTYGVGYGHQLFDSEDVTLSLQGGIDYVIVDRITSADEEYAAFGWGVRYRQWLWRRALQVFHEQEGFWSLEDSENVVLRTRQGVSIPLRKGLNLNMQLNVDWANKPAPGRKATDSTWILGLGYTW